MDYKAVYDLQTMSKKNLLVSWGIEDVTLDNGQVFVVEDSKK